MYIYIYVYVETIHEYEMGIAYEQRVDCWQWQVRIRFKSVILYRIINLIILLFTYLTIKSTHSIIYDYCWYQEYINNRLLFISYLFLNS